MKIASLVCAGLLTLACAVPSYATFTNVSDIFSGTNTSATTVSLSSALLTSTNTTAALGPNFTTTLSLPEGLGYTESISMNTTGAPGDLSFSGSGTLALGGSFSATKTFTGDSFDPSTEYTFSLTESSGAQLSLLSSLNFDLTQNGVTVADTSSGTGILGGAVNVLNLFNTGTTASFNFETSSSLSTSAPFVLTISGATTAGLLNSTVSFTDASITSDAVPEPRTSALLGGGLLLALLRGRSLVRKFQGLDANS